MNRTLYWLDAGLWLVNSVVWYGFAHSVPMAVACFGAALVMAVIGGRIND